MEIVITMEIMIHGDHDAWSSCQHLGHSQQYSLFSDNTPVCMFTSGSTVSNKSGAGALSLRLWLLSLKNNNNQGFRFTSSGDPAMATALSAVC
ncbi:Hypothetical protein SMAX5B_006681 [Scophthalmus maximus]|uniref:Uncharacterized protein n=1 Tax=Scophthalmus maximus TaxID=52904 RepID=A0A2U9BJJ5_SCOMX|nr:Hypothetical protein SMAX5B_006681 [Scophthalmus maximus]